MNKYCVHGKTTSIFITRRDGKKFRALIDTADLPAAKSLYWCVTMPHHYVLAKRKGRTISLHRLVMGDPRGRVVDHLSHNPLDNRRRRLEVKRHAMNLRNRRVPAINASRKRGKWRARICYDRFNYYIGTFTTRPAARRASAELRESLDRGIDDPRKYISKRIHRLFAGIAGVAA